MTETKLSRAMEMMIRTDHMHKALIDSHVKGLGVHRTHHRILMHLARHDKLPSQKELADRLDVTPAAITGALKKIEQDGYVERTLGQDNRYNELRITEKGRELDNKICKRVYEEEALAMENLTESECETLMKLLGKIKQNLINEKEEGNLY